MRGLGDSVAVGAQQRDNLIEQMPSPARDARHVFEKDVLCCLGCCVEQWCHGVGRDHSYRTDGIVETDSVASGKREENIATAVRADPTEPGKPCRRTPRQPLALDRQESSIGREHDDDRTCDLGRFLLLDHVRGNAETWFLARAFRLLRLDRKVSPRPLRGS